MPNNKKGPKKGKKYNVSPEDKLKDGLPWAMHLTIDPEVGLKVIEQKKKSPPGTEYQYLINKALRKAFRLKANP